MRRLLGVIVICVTAPLAALLLGAAGARASGTSEVTTAAYGNLRDDWDSNEPELSPSTLRSGDFGELFSTKLTGSVYAQPLVYKGMVIATTERANAYAINARSGAIEWSRSFGKAFKSSTIRCSDLTPNLGSTSTPVIEPASETLYMTTRLEEGKGVAGEHWYLQAVSASTGEERPGFPVKIDGTPSNTPGVPFNESYQQQRPGLLLLNGVTYIAFASDCDITPYRGVVVGVNATSGAITSMWSDESGVGTGEDSQAGIWQSGGGLVSNMPGRIILTSGNGVSPTPARSNEPPDTLSESVIALTVGPSGELTPSQFFAPSNAPTLDQNDEDLGSGGPIALPTEYFGTKAIPQLVVQVGKDGRIFLVNAEDMGGYRQGPGESDAVLQTLGPIQGVWGHPAAYGGQGGWVYVLGSAGGGNLLALSYGLNGEGLPALSPVASSVETFGYTSGSPLVTSDGTTAGSAVVWVVYENGPNGGRGQLRAYAASPNGETLPLLWSHSIGTASKFAVPTAAEGRVYVGTRSGRLEAFGPTGEAPMQAAPLELGSVPVGTSSTTTLSVSTTKALTLTGPVTAGGEQTATQGASASSPTSSGTSTVKAAAAKSAHPLTAGPTIIPPSGNVPLADGVLTVAQPAVGTAIAAGGSLHLRVTFRPRSAGPVVGTLLIHTSAGERAVTVSGYGSARGLLLSSAPLAFRTIATGGGGKTLTLTFSNSWERPETLTGVRLPRGPFEVRGLPSLGSVLAPRHSVTVSVFFNPRTRGAFTSVLALDLDGRAIEVPVTGAAVTGDARLSVSAEHIDAGAVALGHSRRLTFAIRNTGTVPLTISRAIAPLGAFSATSPLPEGISLEPRTEIHIAVTFRPTSLGPAHGEYRFNSNAGNGYVTVTFSGRGT